MSTKAQSARGTKRRCQAEACGLPFYDLNRTKFDCPMCGASFDLVAAMRPAPVAATRGPGRRPSRYFPAAAPVPDLTAPVADEGDPVEEVEIEVEADAEDGAEVATVETVVEDEDDLTAGIVDVIPEAGERPDE